MRPLIYTPVTPREKWYIVFVGMYETSRRERFRLDKVIYSCPSVGLSVCLYVRMNAKISESTKVKRLGVSIQILGAP